MTETTGGRQGTAAILIPFKLQQNNHFPVKQTEISMINAKQSLYATQIIDLVDVHTLVQVIKMC